MDRKSWYFLFYPIIRLICLYRATDIIILSRNVSCQRRWSKQYELQWHLWIFVKKKVGIDWRYQWFCVVFVIVSKEDVDSETSVYHIRELVLRFTLKKTFSKKCLSFRGSWDDIWHDRTFSSFWIKSMSDDDINELSLATLQKYEERHPMSLFYVLSDLKKLTIRHLSSMEITYVDKHIHVNFLQFLDEVLSYFISFWIVLISSRLRS